MSTSKVVKKDNVAAVLEGAMGAGKGVLRLTPTWVPRSFLHPGKRIKLAPSDWYALGAHRGGIDERWFASTTEAANEGRLPDEGLSYVAFEGQRFLLRDAVAEAGARLIGKKMFDKYARWPVYSKFFDNMGPIPHHMHQKFKHAKLVGQDGKPEAYYFSPQMNNVDNNFAYTFMGLEPGTTKAQVRKCLEDWDKGDNGILDLSRAYRLKRGSGWLIPPGVLHAPGSLCTYEPQWGSDVFGMYQSLVEGREVPWSLLVKDMPPEKHKDLDFIVDELDWEKNVDPLLQGAQLPGADRRSGVLRRRLHRQVDLLRPGGRRAALFGQGADGAAGGEVHSEGPGGERLDHRARLRPDRATRTPDPGHDPLRRGDDGRGLYHRRGCGGGRRGGQHGHRAAGRPAVFWAGGPCESAERGGSQETMNAAPSTNAPTSPEYVVLYGISWQMYEQILEALGEYHLRHTYDRGTLEMRRVLYGVAWTDYQKLLDATAEYKLRHTYDRGTLEMMAPRRDHEWFSKLVGRMIEAMAFALDIPIQSVGSTTLTAALAERGLQPDQSYYVARELQVRGQETYDPDKDPPPDLVIEVDVTTSSIPRLPVFAKIRVPEIWRHDGEVVRFYRLAVRGKYEETDRSVAFPFITPADVTRFLNRRQETDENSLVRSFVQWARKSRKKS